MRPLLEFYTTTRIAGLPLNFIIYGILVTSCWTYSLVRGGAPERIGSTTLLIGFVLTAVVMPDGSARFGTLEIGVLLVDLLCLAAFGWIALRADRYWPLWVAALQFLTVAAHGVKMTDPDMLRRAYAFLIVIWSYPMVFLVMIGAWRHGRRVTHFGRDESWSPLTPAS